MGISVKIIADSRSVAGNRLTTFVLRYPRFIHSELLTHRVFSRNAASSRAIPIEKMIQQVMFDPAMPVKWGSRQKGMQSGPELKGEALDNAIRGWLAARDSAVDWVNRLKDTNLSKEICNRILEPWMYMVSIVTATEWENFFALRCHPDAQPEMKELADMMLQAYRDNAELAELRHPGQWHLPFVGGAEIHRLFKESTNAVELALKCSVARAARVSYLNHDGSIPNVDKDVELHDRLLKSGHMSPFEHAATPMNSNDFSGNFRGWQQYRKTIPGENRNLPNG